MLLCESFCASLNAVKFNLPKEIWTQRVGHIAIFVPRAAVLQIWPATSKTWWSLLLAGMFVINVLFLAHFMTFVYSLPFSLQLPNPCLVTFLQTPPMFFSLKLLVSFSLMISDTYIHICVCVCTQIHINRTYWVHFCCLWMRLVSRLTTLTALDNWARCSSPGEAHPPLSISPFPINMSTDIC